MEDEASRRSTLDFCVLASLETFHTCGNTPLERRTWILMGMVTTAPGQTPPSS